MADITNDLRIGDVEDYELSEVILQFYSHGSEHSPDEIVCSRQNDGPHAVKLKWNGPRITSIESGPGFQNGDLDQLRAKIQTDLLSTEQLHGRSILFSVYPVTSCYRKGSFFQILPAPLTAPRPETTSAPGFIGHPFLIEFPFTSSTNTKIKFGRRGKISFQLSLFLNATLEGAITTIGPEYKRKWVWLDGESSHGPTYRHCQEGYSYEGFIPECTTFTTIEGCESMRQVDPQDYYGQPLSMGRSLELPNSIDLLVSKYFSLANDEQERFLRAAFWLHQSGEITSPSASFLNLIFAIDALIPPESGQTICSSCKQSVGNSLTQRFISFLDDLVPEQATEPEERKTARRLLCRMRGNLAHGRDLLSSDKNAWRFFFNPQGISDWRSRSYAATLAKLTLVNWLQR